ncbi:MAG: branched-chain amino acid ABC transporter substrate-binding protein [Chloroflexi bacterium]|nr:branched-chain amino acid ABC transporter substrate-binding protein [Chloroflexota bacterium]
MFRRLSILFALAVVLAACGPSKPKGEVIVYVAAPLSGWQAEGGQTVVGGVRLMADQLNKSGGLLGYTVRVEAVDDEADSDVAVQVAQKVKAALERGDKVIGVVGHYNSGQTLAAMEVYKDLPIIVITPTASDVSITQKGYKNFFRVNATDAAQGPFDAHYLVEQLGAQRVAVVFADNAYGRGLGKQVADTLRQMGYPPVAEIEIHEGAATQKKAVTAIQKTRPDAVFLAGYETEGYVLLPELRAGGVDVPFLCGDGCFVYAFIDESELAAEGAYVSAITPDTGAVADAAWWKAYQQVEARDPGTYSAAGYSAMHVLAEGVKKAGTFNVTKVEQALHSLDMKSLVGQIRYNAQGDLQNPRIFIFQVKDGAFGQVYPAP